MIVLLNTYAIRDVEWLMACEDVCTEITAILAGLAYYRGTR